MGGHLERMVRKTTSKKVVDSGGQIKLKTPGPEASIDCTGGKSVARWPNQGAIQSEFMEW